MKTKSIKAAMLLGTLAAAATLMGCSVQTKWGAREPVFDFSDHAYYDKSFAPASMAASHRVEGLVQESAGTNEQVSPEANAEITR